jgi:hypothetical protein
MSQWDFGTPPARPPAPQAPPFEPLQPPGAAPGGYPGSYDNGVPDDAFDDGFSPISYERDPYEPDPYGQAGFEQNPWQQGSYQRDPYEHRTAIYDQLWPSQDNEPRRPSMLRWLVPAAIVAVAAAVGGAIVLLSSSSPAAPGTAGTRPTVSRPATTLPPATAGQAPLTLAQAQAVVDRYTTANNEANAQRSDAQLGTIETGSSYAIDAGLYRAQGAEGAAPYQPFGPTQAQYYIPRQQTAYPHWFAVQVQNAGLAAPRKVTGMEYLVFTQAAPGAPWLNAIEPYVVGGSGNAPQIAVGTDGLATAVSATATSLTVSPAQIPQFTATSLDGGTGAQGGLANPGNLADGLDQAFWRKQLAAATITDQHAPAGGAVFGLLTTDGGALMFYTDAAELTLTAPSGEMLHLTIPGFYSPGQALTTAGIGYLEQFAAYVPAKGGTGLRVVADYSGITASN